MATNVDILKAGQFGQIVDKLYVKGLPQTSGAPAGYGQISQVVNDYNARVGDKPKQVMPSDWDGFRMTSSVGTKLYGILQAASKTLVVYDTATFTQQQVTTFTDASQPEKVIAITESLWFVVANLASVYKLFRTSDAGATFQFIQDFNNGITNSSVLSNRSFCQTPSGDLYYVDYNVNPSRVAGGANDRIAVNKSTNQGATWQSVAVFNTDGVKTDFRHFHSIRYNPYNSMLYMQVGDGDTDSGIIAWNPATTLPSNTPINQMPQSDNLRTFQRGQVGRGVDMLFEDDNIYWLVDLDTGGNSAVHGLYTAKANLTGVKKISSANNECPSIAGWYGVKTPSGRQVWVTGSDVPASREKVSGILCTNVYKTEMEYVAKYCLQSSATSIVPYGLEIVGNTIYYSASNPAGKLTEATAGFYITDNDYKQTEVYSSPDTIHPVYWVSKASGNDANSGNTPRAAFATIRYAVTGNRVPYSATIIVQDQLYDYNDSGAIDPVINASLRQGDTSIPLCIRGYGATKTTITGNSANSYTSLALLPTGYTLKLEFKDLTINNAKTNAYTGRITTVTGASALIYTRCIVGDYYITTNNAGTVRAQAGELVLQSSYLTTPAAGTGIDMVGPAALTLLSSAVDCGGINIGIQGAGCTLYSYASVLSGSSTAGIRISAGTTLGAAGISFIYGAVTADNNLTQVALLDLASLSLSSVFKAVQLAIPRGASTAAFDAYCYNSPRGSVNVSASNYVF